MGEACCRIDDHRILAPAPEGAAGPGIARAFGYAPSRWGTRRDFLKRTLVTTAGLTGLDFLRYFTRNGIPQDSRAWAMAADAAQAREPHFLIYWFLEGGWEGYDMFNPLQTANNVIHRLPDVSLERYRVLRWGEPGYTIERQGGIRYGYLAEPGKELLPEMAILSSMHTGSFHSGDRLKAHMGSYNLRLQAERQDDERDVMQAFAEVYGQPFVLPNLAWQYWLSDGELNELQYTGRKGYYHALGPVWAHTIYGGTPANMKQFLMRMQATSSDAVNRQIRSFLDSAQRLVRDDANIEAVKSYHSARGIYEHLAQAGLRLDRSLLSRLFTDPELREEFRVKPEDELISYQSVNGNKARTKFSPNVNVQAMMTYELMRAGLSCAFWIESRDIRRFDSHLNRSGLWNKDGSPRGQSDQTQMMKENLWEPLLALVRRLKSTQHGNSGKSLWDLTTIVLTSEFGRTIHGDVEEIKKMKIPDEDKQKMIDGQDISQHWKVTSAAFLGGTVKGGQQLGGVGEKTMLAIPLLPDGTMDPAFDPVTGELIPGRQPHPKSSIPDHGDVYATALYLSGIDPKVRGRNERPPLRCVKRGT